MAAGRDWFYNFPPMQAGDVCLHVGPISHGSGYLYTPTWLAGGVNVLLDHFDPEETLQVLQDEQVPGWGLFVFQKHFLLVGCYILSFSVPT